MTGQVDAGPCFRSRAARWSDDSAAVSTLYRPEPVRFDVPAEPAVRLMGALGVVSKVDGKPLAVLPGDPRWYRGML